MAPPLEWIYPQLRAFPMGDRAAALRNARRTAFDVVELVGIALSLVLVTALTRYDTHDLAAGERFTAAILNFAVAVPLLVALVGPFHVRRVRRGLQRELHARSGG